MKTLLIITAALFIATFSFAGRAISGNTNTYLDGYKVSQLDENKYLLTYENSSETFTIEVCPKDKECCYLVRGNKIEVMYLCNQNGLGLRKMPLADRQISTDEYCKYLNCKSFKYQSLLTPNKKRTKEALGIIACFFPEVINKDSRTFVFNTQTEAVDQKLVVQQ